MEFHGGSSGGVVVSGNVPAFLTKLWTLVEDPDTDPLICWSPSGTSFHVFDQGRFSKEVLPKFFKHNNMASFVRQLNMYGFRKVVHIEQGGLLKPERDDTEFQHPYFLRGQEQLLENIKRKVTNVSSIKQEELKVFPEEVSKILSDVQQMKGKQETIDSKILAMKHENEALWREIASLRQKHAAQQKVVNKLIQFLVSLVQSNRVLGMKRKIPLMLSDSSSAHSLPKYSRQYSLEHLQSSPAISASSGALSAASLFPADGPRTSGPIISDITDVASSSPLEINGDWIQAFIPPPIAVKQEPSSPEVEEVCPVLEGVVTPVDTPLSPTTFMNSILQDSSEAESSAPQPSTANPVSAANPIVVPEPSHSGSLSTSITPPTNQSHRLNTSSTAHKQAPCLTGSPQKCRSLACIDKTELSEHLENIDSGLENLQTILNAQAINFDSSPLFEFFSSASSSDFDLDSLDNLLSPESVKGADNDSSSANTGKQLVQYMATPTVASEPVILEEDGAEVPSLLTLDGDVYFTSDPAEEQDPTLALLAPKTQHLKHT